jgi:hypothetical protein
MATFSLAGCSVDMGGFAFVNDNSVSARVATSAPQLNPDGTCDGGDIDISPRASAIALGIGECDLVRLKGAAPTDVLIGESGRGQREVQVLYSEPGGRELYLFSDNKLIRIVRPGQG